MRRAKASANSTGETRIHGQRVAAGCQVLFAGLLVGQGAVRDQHQLHARAPGRVHRRLDRGRLLETGGHDLDPCLRSAHAQVGGEPLRAFRVACHQHEFGRAPAIQRRAQCSAMAEVAPTMTMRFLIFNA